MRAAHFSGHLGRHLRGHRRSPQMLTVARAQMTQRGTSREFGFPTRDGEVGPLAVTHRKEVKV